ncbi:hypothetical protein J31TS4_29770 [Paenibacillus sp. J31TS4]|uniref:TraR/DksA C4-type zinc finger protein n=1 Tax=Paenibacillus sp. J31TS4 TaxID=2807195 RepID=UPI001B01EDC0|nr:TraR/DksA C4-type zinc finger protein [Paenibacillus sp. J31TS4]GIP39697.1 hypothetical protein J31TS4_29770 [Paenibacillus sp. J31TS4]
MHQLTNDQLSRLREQLQNEERALAETLQDNHHLGLDDALRDATGELSAYDNHPGDLGTELFERSKDISLNESMEARLIEARDALGRLEAGEYGHCSVCGEPIPFARLEAVPATRFCIDHSRETSVSDRRPVEEQLMAPPFGRTSLDEHESTQTEFDGEDAWQIVESWGTSNSPAMAEGNEVTDYNDMAVEDDENVGYVEPFESFLATDLYGQGITIYRSKAYRDYMDNGEGERLLEPDAEDPGDGLRF